MMEKSKRQKYILELVVNERIATQAELVSLLELEGFAVNQSSVSRDLIELGLIKSGGYYTIPQKSSYAQIGVVSLEIAGDNLIVGKTVPGLASAVCVRIDQLNLAEIVGTIAGEDTIFIAIRSAKEQRLVLRKVWELFEK